jgi:hypothetical protein
MSIIGTVEELEAVYGHPNDASIVKWPTGSRRPIAS